MRYRVHSFGGRIGLTPKSKVTFPNHAPGIWGVKAPNPKFIAIHAAIAHALHLSGAGEVFDKILDEYSDSAADTPSGLRAFERDLGSEDLAVHLSVMACYL